MYSASYGGFPNAVPGNAGSGPTFDGGAPPAQNTHMQPSQSPNMPQMMYSNQQFPMGAQGQFSGGNPASMMAAAGPTAMMQNPGMPHMTPNGQMAYQTPFTSSPYGGGVPATAAPQPQFPANYTMAGTMPHQFQANGGGMPQQQMQQQMMQRMYPQQQNGPVMGVSTPQRQFNPRQGTPGQSTPSQQGQFVAPHNQQGTPQGQIANSAQPPPAAVTTPQTPTFSSNGQGAYRNGSIKESTPLSPGTESRERDAFSLLLSINQELLFESIQLQNTRAEIKKDYIREQSASGDGGGGSNGDGSDLARLEKLIQMDYAQCMRRLQGNLTYLAALADRKVGQVPLCPAHLMPPPLNLSIKMRSPTASGADPSGNPSKPDPEREEKDRIITADRQERDKLMKDLYKKLQALFPGIDPRKEPAYAISNPGAQQPNNGQRPGGPQSGGPLSNQGSPAPAPAAQRPGQPPAQTAPMQQLVGGA